MWRMNREYRTRLLRNSTHWSSIMRTPWFPLWPFSNTPYDHPIRSKPAQSRSRRLTPIQRSTQSSELFHILFQIFNMLIIFSKYYYLIQKYSNLLLTTQKIIFTEENLEFLENLRRVSWMRDIHEISCIRFIHFICGRCLGSRICTILITKITSNTSNNSFRDWLSSFAETILGQITEILIILAIFILTIMHAGIVRNTETHMKLFRILHVIIRMHITTLLIEFVRTRIRWPRARVDIPIQIRWLHV